jgi:hypothetical protein
MPIAVNDPNDEIADRRKEWKILDALMGGTPAMRKAGQELLPMWPAEDGAAYDLRLKTATLFPAYRRTVGVMSGKPFAKPLALKDADPSIEKWAEDIDMQGVSLHSFAAEMFEESFNGLAGIMVSYPRVPPGGYRSKGDMPASVRPYFVRVKHNQILGWLTDQSSGPAKLVQLRILEQSEKPDGPFGVKCIDQVRVLYPGRWEVWQQIDNGKWIITDFGTTSLDVVNFVPIYGIRKGFMCGSPPMLDLAYLNVKHWQSQSDQDTILHVARVPILAMIGADDQSQLTVGGAAAVKLPAGADIKFVEHTGKAIAAGEAALEALVQQMIQTGAELTVKKPGGQRTASQDNNEAEANKSDLQRMAENYEDTLDQALAMMGRFANIAKPGNVELFSDYGAATMGEASATLIKDLHIAGIITGETAIKELQRRGVVSDDVDPDAEFTQAQSEVPALPAVPTGAQGDIP